MFLCRQLNIYRIYRQGGCAKDYGFGPTKAGTAYAIADSSDAAEAGSRTAVAGQLTMEFLAAMTLHDFI